jgi:preprotein translocase subunit SecE
VHFVAVSRKRFMTDQTKIPLTKKIPEFFAQVRQEMRKVTWPTGKETRVTTLVVFIFAIIAAAYFMVVDQVIYRILHLIIG